MYALKHVRMGGNPGAIADIKNEVDVMKAVRGHPCVLTLRAVVLNGPPGAEVRAVMNSAPSSAISCHQRIYKTIHSPTVCARYHVTYIGRHIPLTGLPVPRLGGASGVSMLI